MKYLPYLVALILIIPGLMVNLRFSWFVLGFVIGIVVTVILDDIIGG